MIYDAHVQLTFYKLYLHQNSIARNLSPALMIYKVYTDNVRLSARSGRQTRLRIKRIFADNRIEGAEVVGWFYYITHA